MAILITGGKGFVGSVMIRKLVHQGHEVVCLDLKRTPGRLGDVADRVTMLEGGVPGIEGLMKIIQDHHVDRIAHMVFFMSDQGNAEQIRTEVSSMVMDTTNVFEAARRTGIKRVLFPSSIHYYGPQWLHGETMLNEESPSLAESIYGVGKKMNETVARKYNTRAGMEIISMRIPAVYGPGARVGARGVNIAAVECAQGKPATFPYPAEEKVCVAHVEDVADALIKGFLTGNLRYDVYNIGGHILSYWELASLIRGLLPGAQIFYNEAGVKTDLAYLIDYSRIREEFRFEHRDLKEGYLEVINLTRREAGLSEIGIEMTVDQT
ncbi:MAG: NAD(P)-dependent oxidoreductase [Pseudomonadota bacterium]